MNKIRFIVSYTFIIPAFILIFLAELVRGDKIVRSRDLLKIFELLDDVEIICKGCGRVGNLSMQENYLKYKKQSPSQSKDE